MSVDLKSAITRDTVTVSVRSGELVRIEQNGIALASVDLVTESTLSRKNAWQALKYFGEDIVKLADAEIEKLEAAP